MLSDNMLSYFFSWKLHTLLIVYIFVYSRHGLCLSCALQCSFTFFFLNSLKFRRAFSFYPFITEPHLDPCFPSTAKVVWTMLLSLICFCHHFHTMRVNYCPKSNEHFHEITWNDKRIPSMAWTVSWHWTKNSYTLHVISRKC
jgi:hypothetical protein